MYMKWSWNIVSKAKGMVGYSQGCGSGGFEGVVEEDGGGVCWGETAATAETYQNSSYILAQSPSLPED